MIHIISKSFITLYQQGVWKDVLQTKLKRKRTDHPDHEQVKLYQSKYSKIGSGRPVKKMTSETAKRDRQKQIFTKCFLLIL